MKRLNYPRFLNNYSLLFDVIGIRKITRNANHIPVKIFSNERYLCYYVRIKMKDLSPREH